MIAISIDIDCDDCLSGIETDVGSIEAPAKKARQVVLQTGQPNPHRRWDEAR